MANRNAYDVIVVGGGPAGMMAAVSAAQQGCRTALIEKGDRLGRKLIITGKGRCNVTNTKSWQEFSTHIHPSPHFFRFAFRHLTNSALMAFLEENGAPLTVERGDRVFPQSSKSRTVLQALERALYTAGVEVFKSRTVRALLFDKPEVVKITCATSYGELEFFSCRKVIVATGGLSYPDTGSTGDGYRLAEAVGHKVTRCFPSLTGLLPEAYRADLQGISLKNVGLTLFIGKDLVQSCDGDLDFTDLGIEGSLGNKVSRKAVKAMDDGQKVELVLDLKPAMTRKMIADRIVRELGSLDFNPARDDRRQMERLLRRFLPAQLVVPFYEANAPLTLSNLPDKLKEWRFRIDSYVGYRRAVITAGGICTDELIAKSMQSRIEKDLFFAGEVLDLDADTGGYNLQIAFSTGSLAGWSAAQQILKSNITV